MGKKSPIYFKYGAAIKGGFMSSAIGDLVYIQDACTWVGSGAWIGVLIVVVSYRVGGDQTLSGVSH